MQKTEKNVATIKNMEKEKFILALKKAFYSRAALALSYPHTPYTSAQHRQTEAIREWMTVSKQELLPAFVPLFINHFTQWGNDPSRKREVRLTSKVELFYRAFPF